jgi:DNA-binding NarL/FixJ family response regulator
LLLLSSTVGDSTATPYDRSIVVSPAPRVTVANTRIAAAAPVGGNRSTGRCHTQGMRVVVAEDVMLMREGIVRLLRDEGIDVVAAVGDQASLMSALGAHEPDCAIVDIRMPPTHTDEGIVAARHIRELHPNTGVLVLSQYVEPAYALQLLEHHPERVGYLLKERVSDAAVLVDTLHRLSDGETVIDPTIVSRLLGRHREPNPIDELSPREREVLALVAEGFSNAAISKRLFVTERTVEWHVKQIFNKLRMAEAPDTNRRVLAVLAFLRSPT